MSWQFLDRQSLYETSRFIVVPVPYEATTTYGKGAKNGPAAILNASEYVEDFDAEIGIHTLKPVSIQNLPSVLQGLLKDGKIPVILGGEHSLSPFAVSAFACKFKNLSVLQLDAHADLRDSYKGSRNNHACVMRRVLEICPAIQLGIRNISKEEWEFAKESHQIEKIHWAEEIGGLEKILEQLSEQVYITLDVDVFDPSVVPSTGAPEPGGWFWYQVLDLLKGVCAAKRVVGFDVVELSPIKNLHAVDFTIAKLIYKIISYLSLK